MDENRTLLMNLQNELDALEKKQRRDTSDFKNFVTNQDENGNINTRNQSKDFQAKVSELLSLLAQIIAISQALDEQDEIDRKSIQLIGRTSSEFP